MVNNVLDNSAGVFTYENGIKCRVLSIGIINPYLKEIDLNTEIMLFS
jgi:hypothetical protein